MLDWGVFSDYCVDVVQDILAANISSSRGISAFIFIKYYSCFVMLMGFWGFGVVSILQSLIEHV